jgi:hypothetical protein
MNILKIRVLVRLENYNWGRYMASGGSKDMTSGGSKDMASGGSGSPRNMHARSLG